MGAKEMRTALVFICFICALTGKSYVIETEDAKTEGPVADVDAGTDYGLFSSLFGSKKPNVIINNNNNSSKSKNNNNNNIIVGEKCKLYGINCPKIKINNNNNNNNNNN